MANNITRVCKKCNVEQELNVENYRPCKGTIYFKCVCRECERRFSREYQRAHTDLAKKNNQAFYAANPKYREQYKKNNKDHIKKYRAEYEARLHVKLKKRVSRAIHHALKRKNLKKTINTLSFLPYSIESLKTHLESQFEHWMNWDNWGVYNPKKWDDNDYNTWTWQIDHIKPMAKHVYYCQEDPEFAEAWKLENLRPLRAKDNIILGAKMKRIKNTTNLEDCHA